MNDQGSWSRGCGGLGRRGLRGADAGRGGAWEHGWRHVELRTQRAGRGWRGLPLFDAQSGFLTGSPRDFFVAPSASRLVSFLLFGFVPSL